MFLKQKIQDVVFSVDQVGAHRVDFASGLVVLCRTPCTVHCSTVKCIKSVLYLYPVQCRRWGWQHGVASQEPVQVILSVFCDLPGAALLNWTDVHGLEYFLVVSIPTFAIE